MIIVNVLGSLVRIKIYLTNELTSTGFVVDEVTFDDNANKCYEVK